MVDALILIGLVALVAIFVRVSLRSWEIRRSALARLYAMDDQLAGIRPESRDSAFTRWLARAGYRKPNAQNIFIGATAGCVVLGIAISQAYRLVLLRPLVLAVSVVPGNAGDMLALLLESGPWILLLISGVVPTLVVRAA